MPFHDLIVVRLIRSQATKDGPIPAGTRGTVVSHYGDPDSDFVAVEFDALWHVVDVSTTDLEPWTVDAPAPDETVTSTSMMSRR
jgi:hypothetical protein